MHEQSVNHLFLKNIASLDVTHNNPLHRAHLVQCQASSWHALANNQPDVEMSILHCVQRGVRFRSEEGGGGGGGECAWTMNA